MDWKRTLHHGMHGLDVLWIKRQLFALGYYAPELTSIEKDRFGADTQRAVRAFQRENRDENGAWLPVDGVIASRTWSAIVRATQSAAVLTLPENIGKRAAAAIAPELARISSLRQELVLHALSFAYDPLAPSAYPHSLYIRGGNLYNTDLRINVITPARIEAGAKRQPEYYSQGRKEMMLAAVRADPSTTGADCSGGIVGLMRHFELVAPAFDATADLLSGDRYSTAIKKEALRAGDWVGRTQHIGIYVGGGYVVEWMGGAYGCQLTQLDARRGFRFTTHQLMRQSPWTRFRRPDAY